MTDNIFGADQNAPNTNSPVDQLVGEGKKFKTIEDLAKSKLEADSFIDRLKAENEELRNEVATRARLEEIADRLTSRNAEENDDEFNHDSNSSSGQPAISERDLDRLISQKITAIELKRTANQNRLQAMDELRRAFGADYLDKLEARAQALGLEKSYLNDLAGKSPTAFMELVLPPRRNSDDRMPTAPRNQVNTDSFRNGGNNPEPGSWAFYEKLKKDNPALYWSPKVQNQMHNDMIKKARTGGDPFSQ